MTNMNFTADFRPCLAIGNTPLQHEETSEILGGRNHAAQYVEEVGEVLSLREKERRLFKLCELQCNRRLVAFYQNNDDLSFRSFLINRFCNSDSQ